jgi:3D (Asp-Asp-Asp) domain-containing protein
VAKPKPIVVVMPAVGDVPKGVANIGDFRVTCYSGGTRTASGERIGLETVAVDPLVIPLRSRIYIDGVGWRTALDTGVYGKSLDIWMPTNADCSKWGAKMRAVFAAVGSPLVPKAAETTDAPSTPVTPVVATPAAAPVAEAADPTP